MTAAEQIFKDLVWDPLIKVGEQALESAVPALRLPVLNQIEEGTIQVITDWAYAQIIEFVDVNTIRLSNAAHQTAYDAASLKLKIVTAEFGAKSQQYLEAKNAELVGLAKFTHMAAS